MFRYLYFNRKKKFFLSRSGQRKDLTAGLPETSTGASKIIVMIMAIENSNSAKSLTAISDGRSITAKKTA